MFSKVKEENKNHIYIKSSMHNIPDDVEHGNKQVAEKLLSLVKLIGEKYRLENVQARFEKSHSSPVSVVLFNGRHGVDKEGIDSENIKPVEYLLTFGGKVEKEENGPSYWSNSIITLDRSNIDSMIEGLQLLVTPDGPREPRMVARC